jgi:Fur family ferric uptake transcriptional regulator
VSNPPLGQRDTRHRRAILETIRRAEGPLTAGAIRRRARQTHPTLGIATVYRTLRLLLEAGRIREVTLPDGRTRYESAHLGHHHHFRCRDCDHVYDLDHCPVSFPEGATLPGGFRVEDHELTLFGTCPKCASENPPH